MNTYVNFPKNKLVEVLSCTLDKAEIAMGDATFNIEHTTSIEWFDVTTPDGYSTGQHDFEVSTNINKVSLWCMPGLEIDITSAFVNENLAYEDDFIKAIEQEVRRQQITTLSKDQPDFYPDFLNDDHWPKTTKPMTCPAFAHLQSHKTY